MSSGLGIYDLEKAEARAATSRRGRSAEAETAAGPPHYASSEEYHRLDMPRSTADRESDSKSGGGREGQRRYGHRRISTQALIALASRTTTSTPTWRLVSLFVACFTGTYLAAFVPVPGNIFAAQRAAVQSHHPHGYASVGGGGRTRGETAFAAAGGGSASLETWALLGDELAPGAGLGLSAAAIGDDGPHGFWGRLFGKRPEVQDVVVEIPGRRIPVDMSDVGKDLPYPSWQPPSRGSDSLIGGGDDGMRDEILIIERHNGEQTVIQRLPLPFQRTVHSPPSRFADHDRVPVSGSAAARKHVQTRGGVAAGALQDDDDDESGPGAEEGGMGRIRRVKLNSDSRVAAQKAARSAMGFSSSADARASSSNSVEAEPESESDYESAVLADWEDDAREAAEGVDDAEEWTY